MHRCLEFALATFMITVINSLFAIWAGSLIADRVRLLFEQLFQALNF